MFDPHIFIPIAHAAEEAAVEAASGGVAGTLGLDAKLFIAQLVNFGIVLLVLWKFVFTPVAKKLQERTEKIEQSMLTADRIRTEKDEFAAWKKEEMAKTRQQAGEIITAAQTEGAKAREEAINLTRQDQSKLVEQTRRQIEHEKEKAVAEAKEELAHLVTSASEKILREKLDSKKDAEFIRQSIQTLR